MNFTCFIENAQPEEDDEGSGHLEAELIGEFHFHLFLFLKEISKLGVKEVFLKDD